MTSSEREASFLEVSKIIKSDVAISSADGTIVYGHIVSDLRSGKIVTVSFAGIRFLISAFLNTAIGLLYKDYESEFLNSNLKIIEITPSQRGIIRAVAENAKNYYSQATGSDQ